MADFDPLTAPIANPVTVRRVNDQGFPSQFQLEWEQATRSWMINNAVDLNTKITTVEDMAGENAASIIVEANARATADAALAQQITTVSTTVAGNTASITQLFTSVNGIGVQYAVQGYVGGSYGGFVFTGVQRADGVGGTFLLEITSNVIINGNLMVTGSILNEGLSNSAVSRAWAAEGATSASITPGFRGSGFLEIYAQFKGDANAYSAVDQFVLRVREDGNLLGDTPINHAQNGTGSSAASRYGSTSIVYIRVPSTGGHTYSVEIVKTISATGLSISGVLITAKEFSK